MFSQKYIHKNENLLCALQWPLREKDTTFTRLCTIEFTIDVQAFLDYIHPTTNNRINEKRPQVPSFLYIRVRVRNYFSNYHNQIPIYIYVSHMLVRFNILRHFRARLSVRVSYSGQPFSCTIKYFTKINYNNINTCTQKRFTHHRKLQHTTPFLHHYDSIQK